MASDTRLTGRAGGGLANGCDASAQERPTASSSSRSSSGSRGWEGKGEGALFTWKHRRRKCRYLWQGCLLFLALLGLQMVLGREEKGAPDHSASSSSGAGRGVGAGPRAVGAGASGGRDLQDLALEHPLRDYEGGGSANGKGGGEEHCSERRKELVTYGRIKLPNLRPQRVLRTAKPRGPHVLSMLESQCRSWTGLTSAAVYFPLIFFQPDNEARLVEARATVDAFHAKMERETGVCKLDLVLVSEVIKVSDLWAYPYNALRNHALARAATEVVFLLDADFIVSAGLHEHLSQPGPGAALQAYLEEQKRVVVLPAFEPHTNYTVEEGGEYALQAVKSSKEALQADLWEPRRVVQFAEFYPVGHRASNYVRWFGASEPYPIRYRTGYEPYVLVSRAAMPWYDERFRGYGWDKVMQIYHMSDERFKFMGHPRAWVVHRPHPPSAGYKHTFRGDAYSLKHKPTDHLFKMERIAKDMMNELKLGTYPEEGVTQLAACRNIVKKPKGQAVPWW